MQEDEEIGKVAAGAPIVICRFCPFITLLSDGKLILSLDSHSKSVGIVSQRYRPRICSHCARTRG